MKERHVAKLRFRCPEGRTDNFRQALAYARVNLFDKEWTDENEPILSWSFDVDRKIMRPAFIITICAKKDQTNKIIKRLNKIASKR